MQHSSFQAPYRHRSPNLSDSDDGDHASTSSTSSHPSSNTVLNLATPLAGPSSAATPVQQRAQRPRLNNTRTATSGSFVRIKRKPTPASTSPPPTLQDHQHSPLNNAATAGNGERTVDQIPSKTCFICYGDSSEDSTAPSSTPNIKMSERKWIHPCKCSLLAHEDCLLHWVQVSKPAASKDLPVLCPQCNTPYTINQVDFPILNFIERIEAIWTKNVSKLLMVGIGMGSWTLLGLYGLWSIRQLAGDRLAEQRTYLSLMLACSLAHRSCYHFSVPSQVHAVAHSATRITSHSPIADTPPRFCKQLEGGKA